jgi:hypothetical protein
VKWLGLILLIFGAAALAQEAPKKKKKPAAKQVELKAHQKPTPEQIRRFNELQKKQGNQ